MLAVRIEVRGSGSRAAAVLAYEAQVAVSVLVCLAALLSQYRWCCWVGQGPRRVLQGRSRGHQVKLHASCACVEGSGNAFDLHSRMVVVSVRSTVVGSCRALLSARIPASLSCLHGVYFVEGPYRTIAPPPQDTSKQPNKQSS